MIATKERAGEAKDEDRTRAYLDSIFSQRPIWHTRYDCERDPLVLQPIPYCIIFGREEDVFCYQRASNRKEFGDKRLFGKWSIGIGGHIVKEDGHSDHPSSYVFGSLRRESDEELIIRGKLSTPQLVGKLYSASRPVDTAHFGLIFAAHVQGIVLPREPSILSGSMRRIDELQQEILDVPQEKFETWTSELVPHLYKIRGRLKTQQ